MRNRSAALIATAALAAVATGVGVGLADESDSSTATQSAEVSSPATDDVASLRREPTPADRPTADDIADSPLVGGDDVAIDQSRKVSGTDEPTFIAPTTDGASLCAIGAGEMSCADADVVVEEGAAPAVYWHADGSVHLAGIVSDAVGSVTVVYGDGSTQTVEAVDNFVDADLRERPAAIRWSGPQGPEEITAPSSSLVDR